MHYFDLQLFQLAVIVAVPRQGCAAAQLFSYTQIKLHCRG
jgi:hypothetical protein